MNYRTTTLLAEMALTGAGTEIIPINVRDVISRITIAWRVSQSGHGMNSYCHKDITKIELIDGSDVLFGMDGGQAQALCIYDRKVPTMNHGQAMDGSSAYSVYGIDFGRFLNDPLLALDPAKFRNLQLKITYDVDVMDEAASTAYLEVWAEVFDEKVVSPIGFLMSKEHYNAVPPASGYRYVDLPTDYPVRKMLVQGYLSAYEPWYTVKTVRLSEDNEKRIPLDLDMEDYYRVRKGIDQPIQENIVSRYESGWPGLYCTPTDYWATLALAPYNPNATTAYTMANRGGVFTLSGVAGLGQFQGIVQGWLPNHCFQFPFGDEKDIDDWYDVTRLGSLRARLEVGTYSASARMAIVLQQLRRY